MKRVLFKIVAITIISGTTLSHTIHAQILEENCTLVHEFFGGSCSGLAQTDSTLFVVIGEFLLSADVSDPANPKFLDTLNWEPRPYPPPNSEFGVSLIANDNYLYLFARYQDIIIFDAHDPSNIIKLDTIAVDNEYPMVNAQLFDSLLVINAYSELLIYAVSDPLRPTFLNRYKLHTGHYLSGYYFPPYYIIGDTILISNALSPNDSLYQGIMGSNGSIYLTRSFPSINRISAVYSAGDILYVGHWHESIQQYNPSLRLYMLDNGFTPHFISRIDTWTHPTEIEVHGDYVYCLQSDACGFFVIDIADIYAPKIVARFGTDRWAYAEYMEIIGDYVYFGTAANGLVVVRIDWPDVRVEEESLPYTFTLSPAYPNPFSGSTTISYALPTQQHISLDVYNTLGRNVETLYNGPREPGSHSARLDASALPAGTYRVVLRSGEGMKTQMVVVR